MAAASVAEVVASMVEAATMVEASETLAVEQTLVEVPFCRPL